MNDAEYNKWFSRLWSGTESFGNHTLFGKNDTHSLIRIIHPPSYVRYGGRLPGCTEYYVCVNGEYEHSWNCPIYVWKKEGRLLNTDKKFIEETFKIKYTKK